MLNNKTTIENLEKKG